MTKPTDRLQAVADVLKGHPDMRGYPGDVQHRYDAARFLAMFDVATDHLFPGGVAEPGADAAPAEAASLPMACVHAREVQAHELGFRQGIARGLEMAQSAAKKHSHSALDEWLRAEIVRIRCGGAIEVSAGGEPVRATPESVELAALRELVRVIDETDLVGHVLIGGRRGADIEREFRAAVARARTIVNGDPRAPKS